jgi:major membrane immunogen (membrane-anchored lipoprotein)
MKNFYEATCKKSVLLFTCGVLLFFGASAQQVVTYDTTFQGWNAVVTMDKALTGNDSAAGIVFFPGLGEETTDSAAIVVNGPHYLIRNGIWDGSVPLGNGVHHPFIISLQPPASGYPASSVYPKIMAILGRYRIKRNSFYLTGLSMGGWYSNQFVCYEPTPGDDTYGHLVRAIVVLEGVEPADSTQPYPSLSYPRKMGHWASACGGRELWVEGSQDWRDMLAGAQNMCDSVPGVASYFQVTYGGGAHCCWNTEYEPSTTWTMPSNSNISQVWGTPQPMNVWQWLLRQGDTTMPTYSAPAPGPPTVNAGAAQTIQLPTSSLTLTGQASGVAGATISTVAWTEVSGPTTASFSAAGNLTTTVSGMTTAGTYIFQLEATDNNGRSATSTITVTVDAANVPPTVSAGSAQTIQLPVSSVTLSGTATGNGGATIGSTAWTEISGPATATIAAAPSLTTSVTGLTVAGSYVFQLKATDDHGLSATATVTVTVDAANIAPTVIAGSAQTIQLPVNSVSLSGTATGNGGATISSTVWTEISGPAIASFSAAASLTTTASGMTAAGTYVFQLKATDNNGLSATSTVTITVDAANVPPTVSAGGDQTIQLPVSSVMLSGTATGNGGATISSTAWTEVSGPVTVTIAAASGLSTGVSGLTTAGTYVFQFKATDNNGLSSTATVTVTVQAPAPPVNVPPTVSAGSAQTIQLPVSSVNLSGTATGNDGATISSTVWTEVSGPVTATIAGASGLSTAVTGMTMAGSYVFELKATDNNGLSTTAAVTITVQAAPPPVNVPPTVSAGNDLTIQLPVSSVTLNGSATGNGGATISSTVWTEVSGPVTATIATASGLSTAVTGLTTAGTYVFQLQATDNNGLSATAAVTITVQAAAPPPVQHVPPVADAGPNQTVTLPVSTATLDGSGSYDTDGTITAYSWVQVSGSAVMIANANQVQATLTGLVGGTYVFQLTVTDNSGATGVATVTITVNPAPVVQPPVANAGSDTTIAMPADSAILNGSGSTGPAGQALTFQWGQISGPTEALIGSSGSATSRVGGLTPGLYVFSLKVTDASGQSDTASVQVRVINNQRSAGVDTGSAAFTVYPNPVGSLLVVRFTDPNTSGPVLLLVYDMKGRLVVSEETVVSGGGQLVNFNVAGLAKGVYALEVVAGKSRSYQMIVKQ